MPKSIELFRLIRLPNESDRGYSLVLEINGRRFERLADIPNERVQQVIREAISTFLQTGCTADDLKKMGLIDSDLEAALRNQETVKAQEVDDFLDSLASGTNDDVAPADLTREVEPAPPPTSLLDRFRARSRPAPEEPEGILPPLNIGSQINDLVQAQKQNFPELDDRSIVIRPDLHGGIRIIVDGQQFEDVAEIEDPQVRMVIKSAIKIWENSI